MAEASAAVPLLERVGGLIFHEHCVDALLRPPYESILEHTECLQDAVAHVLGMAMIAGSAVLKLPQIIAIVRSGSVAGISPASIYLELPLMTTTLIYSIMQGAPFTAYGEAVIIAVQALILIFMYWAYTTEKITMREKVRVIVLQIAWCVFLAFFVPRALPLPCALAQQAKALTGFSVDGDVCVADGTGSDAWGTYDMQPVVPLLTVPISLSARVPQILMNIRNRSTGSLSLTTYLLQFAGGVARVFTTVRLMGFDVGTLLAYGTGILVNGTIMAQIIGYGLAASTKKARAKKKQETAKKQD